MGIYVLGGEDIVEEFYDFLTGLEGDCSAETIAEAWNNIAKKEKWDDRLLSTSKKDFTKFTQKTGELK